MTFNGIALAITTRNPGFMYFFDEEKSMGGLGTPKTIDQTFIPTIQEQLIKEKLYIYKLEDMSKAKI